MALPSFPGPIRLSQLQTEFGGTNPIRLGGEYHAGQGLVASGLSGYPIVDGVSTKTLIPSGTTSRISLGNFFGGDVTEFYFVADYIVLTYYFDTGLDLDTRTKLSNPDPGGGYVGWGWYGQQGQRIISDPSYAQASQDLPNGQEAVTWAGDNRGTGLESALVNVSNIRGYYGNTTITVELRGLWFQTVGTTPVKIQADLYKGGTMRYLGGQYAWDNPTATASKLDIASGQINATDIMGPTGSTGFSNPGTAIASLTYNTASGQGTIDMAGTGF